MKLGYYLLALIVLLVFPGFSGCGGKPQNEDGYKAAIIDQLYLRQPNPGFIEEATSLLKSAGFEVDIWQGNEITVDFYRDLPSMGYRFIVLRVHSGTLLEIKDGQTVEMPDTYLFTAEDYTTASHVTDQLTDKVSYAVMEDNIPAVFAVSSRFIEDAKGAFNKTVVLSMGCESYRHDDLLQAFIAKGASVYIGWSDLVSLEHVDKVTLDLLKNYCTAGMGISPGISQTMATFGRDPYFNSYLKFYPESNAAKTIQELTK